MSRPQPGCFSRAQLELLVRGGADPSADAHLTACPTCAAQWTAIREENAFLREFRAARQAPPREARPEVPGYDLISELSTGGQGVVYRALERSTRREVAVKLPRAVLAATPTQLRRFDREIEVVGQLRHPHIVTLFGATRTTAGVPAFAMELVTGAPLDVYRREKLLAGAPRPTKRAEVAAIFELFATIARAVGYAHQRGVMHRDLKPANILVDEAGAPHILDFGLGALLREDAEHLTQTHEFAGTLDYAAPEQVGGVETGHDVRTDVYALGVMLYRALTGASPHPTTGGLASRVHAILHDAPAPPRTVNPALDAEVSAILLRTLAKSRETRYASAVELAADLENYVAGRPVIAKGDSGWYQLRVLSRRYRWPLALGLTLVLLSLGVAVVMTALYRDAQSARSAADAALAESRIERGRLLSASGAIAAAEDLLWGEYFARADSRSVLEPAYWSLVELYLRHPCLRTWELSHPLARALLAPTSDGEDVVLMTSDRMVCVVPIDRSSAAMEQHAAVVPVDVVMHFDAATRRFLVCADDKLWEVTLDGTAAPLLDLPIQGTAVLAGGPDGRHFVARHPDGGLSEIELPPGRENRCIHRRLASPGHKWHKVRYADADRLLLLNSDGELVCRRRSGDGFEEIWRRRDAHGPDGWLVCESDDRYAMVEHPPGRRIALVDIADGSLHAELADQAFPRITYARMNRALTHIALTMINDTSIALVDIGGTRPTLRLSGHHAPVHWLAWSSAVPRLISVSRSAEIKTWAVPEVNSGLRRWGLGGGVLAVAWHPEDRTALAAPAKGGVFRLDPGRPEPDRRIAASPVTIAGVRFLPDGQGVLIADYDGVIELHPGARSAKPRRIPILAGRIRSIALFQEQPRVAIAGDDGRVYCLNYAEEQVQASAPQRVRCAAVAVSPDGRMIASGNQIGDLTLYDAATLKPQRELLNASGAVYCIRALAFSPDGRSLAVAGDEGLIQIYIVSDWTQPTRTIVNDETIYALSFSGDGALLAAGDGGGALQIWDPASGRNLLKLDAHEGPIYAVELSADGRRVLSGGDDGAVRIFDFDLADRCVLGNLDAAANRLELSADAAVRTQIRTTVAARLREAP